MPFKAGGPQGIGRRGVVLMKHAVVALFAVAFLLFAGCAQSSPPAAPPAGQPQAPQQPAPVIPSPPAPPPNETPGEPPAAQPPLAAAACNVQFQKDTSNIYYVMVNPGQPGSLKVSCPNGLDAVKQGELYFCAQLDAAGPTIAYLNGVECGRADFSQFKAVQPGKQSCSVLLSPSRITAGQTSQVTVQAYVPQERSTLSYLCGDREVNETAGGMVDTGKICQFNSPGTVEVYAKLNGEVCASSLLTVFATPKDCSVYNSSFAMQKGEYVYSAKVAARGYSGTDYLRYSCYGVPHAIQAYTIQNTTDFVTSIECRSASGPLSGNVPVTMGGDACGEMQIPS